MKSLIFLAISLLVGGGVATADDGWLGVQLQTLDPELTKTLQLPDDQGVLVDSVVEDSPAASAGLKQGDVIVAFAGNPVHEVKDLTKAVRKADPGDEVAVTVLRDGQRQDLKVTLGKRDDRNVFVLRHGDGDEIVDWPDKLEKHLGLLAPQARGGYLGIGMQDLTEQLGAHFGVQGGEGVLVSEVKPDTPAAVAGIEAGDVIVKAGGEAVANTGDLRAALADKEPGSEIAFEVIRDGQNRTYTAKLGGWPEGDGARVHLDRMHGELPRMREFLLPGGEREIRVLRPDGAEVDALRGEVERLRKDLDELRQELKNR